MGGLWRSRWLSGRSLDPICRAAADVCSQAHAIGALRCCSPSRSGGRAGGRAVLRIAGHMYAAPACGMSPVPSSTSRSVVASRMTLICDRYVGHRPRTVVVRLGMRDADAAPLCGGGWYLVALAGRWSRVQWRCQSTGCWRRGAGLQTSRGCVLGVVLCVLCTRTQARIERF